MQSFPFPKTPVGFLLPKAPAIDRDELIVDRCKGKVVLHLGCVDYPLLDERLLTNQLLHQKLVQSAKSVWGVDLDEAGIRRLTAECRIDKLLVADAEHLETVAGRIEQPEIVVAGEILEHVNNPGLVLAGIRNLLQPGGELLITVPNALAMRIWVHTFRHRENIHPDHVVYFSPYTISNLVSRFGFRVTRLWWYWYPSTRPTVNVVKQKLFRWLAKRWSFIGDGLILLAVKE
jgi:2-polyprenyl-3-methyl-5-hydroxy-6-metoxy-1,4-benzoquinol methylase